MPTCQWAARRRAGEIFGGLSRTAIPGCSCLEASTQPSYTPPPSTYQSSPTRGRKTKAPPPAPFDFSGLPRQPSKSVSLASRKQLRDARHFLFQHSSHTVETGEENHLLVTLLHPLPCPWAPKRCYTLFPKHAPPIPRSCLSPLPENETRWQKSPTDVTSLLRSPGAWSVLSQAGL